MELWLRLSGVHLASDFDVPRMRRRMVLHLFENQCCSLRINKKHLKNVGPIRHCEPPHALILHCHSPGVATVARRLRIEVHDDDDDNNDNA